MFAEKLILFVKAPRPGAVKTRLAQSLGADGACRAYQELVETLLEKIAPLSNVELRFTPDDAGAEIAAWQRNSWQISSQGEGDLGQRLMASFQNAFDNGSRRVVIIGSDCPDLTTHDIEEAWRELDGHDVVFGPATDGGYWLVGLRAPQPALFQGMTWSTPDVLQESLRRAGAAKLSVYLLRELTDVDSEAEWRLFARKREEGS